MRSDGKPVERYSERRPRRSKKRSQPGTSAHRQELLEQAEVEAIVAAVEEVVEEVAETAAPPGGTIVIGDGKEPLTDYQKIWAIRNIIDDGQVEWLQAENTRLATRVASLESDLRALKDLIGGIK
jgi:phosphoglucomutase